MFDTVRLTTHKKWNEQANMTKPSIRSRFVAVVLGVSVAIGAQTTLASTQDGPRAEALKRMVSKAEAKQWTAARDAALSLRDPVAIEAYEWLRLRQPGIDNFERMARWVDAHPDWPDERRIQSQGESALTPGAFPPERLVAFFDRHAPHTGKGAALYAEALQALGQHDRANRVATDAWLNKDLTSDYENRLMSKFGRILEPLQDERLDRLIWRTRLTPAGRQLRRASGPARALGRARIALLKNDRGVDPLVRAVPASLRNDPGLAYARMIWRKKRGLRSTAEDMMLEMSRRNLLGTAEKWGDERALFVREALDRKSYERAYALAAGHGLSDGKYFADMEWISGWIALRKLGNPKTALSHFSRLHQGVETPVSKARAAFWAGEAAAELGDTAGAQTWRTEGARYQSAFYGQLASERLTGQARLNIPEKIPPSNGPCTQDRRVAVGSALALGGAVVPARTFFYDAAATCSTPNEIKALGLIAEKQGAFRISVGMSRKVRRDGVFIPEISHPLVRLPVQGCKGMKPPERALTLAIARQESGFDPTAGSSAGAQGVMQVMPATAKRTVRAAGLKYSRARLGSDRNYNAIIGQCYLSQMLERFEGSYPLAIASYNAGPRRIDDWIKRNGDPRKGEIDMVDWIERIPFHETRNYVQRVLENVAVYRARMR